MLTDRKILNAISNLFFVRISSCLFWFPLFLSSEFTAIRMYASVAHGARLLAAKIKNTVKISSK